LTAAVALVLMPTVTPSAAAPGSKGTPDAQALWKELTNMHYEQWAPWPGQDTDFYPGRSPHGKKLKLFVNRTTFGDLTDPPPGSIIIKENYSPDEKLMAITIMKRVEDYDPDNNDWYWVKYGPDGSVAQHEDMQVVGKVQSCIACHARARGDDYIFTNDNHQHQHEDG
jgi:hypothetical protein